MRKTPSPPKVSEKVLKGFETCKNFVKSKVSHPMYSSGRVVIQKSSAHGQREVTIFHSPPEVVCSWSKRDNSCW